ncbi:polysaccharide deacetylase family protein [Oricola sp.]|uniref:polysaccharide deacetylase family protein n=1 Tax=Oricola sp. TaxID=1979950 RepID=UPI003BAB827D
MTDRLDTYWNDLDAELATWAAAGQTVRLWLRDDDAVASTDALRRLIGFARQHEIAVLLAVIPDLMRDDLVAPVAATPHIDVAVHGLSHASHAREGEKKIELGGTVDPEDLLARLATARNRLHQSFGTRATNILVPPWNRIEPSVSARAGTAGFAAISGFGWMPGEIDMPWLNTHVDIIDWRGTRGGKPVGTIAEETLAALKRAREADFAPVGILAHHLVHDEAAWLALDQLAKWAARHQVVSWNSARSLLAA